MSPKTHLLTHPKTQRQLENFIKQPAHAVLITGPEGSGKAALGRHLVAQLLKLPDEKPLEDYPYFRHLMKPADKREIPIDSIREIKAFLRLKTPGKSDLKRAILIENSHELSEEAQNALLKILEEPSSDTVFVLTAPSAFSVAPTIASRCQRIEVHEVSEEQALGYFSDKFPANSISSAWQLSQGAPSLLAALLENKQNHPLKVAIDRAKSWLKLTPYERAQELDKLTNNRQEFLLTIQALSKVVAAVHRAALTRRRSSQADKILTDRRLLESLEQQVEAGANLKLAALELTLNLKALI